MTVGRQFTTFYLINRGMHKWCSGNRCEWHEVWVMKYWFCSLSLVSHCWLKTIMDTIGSIPHWAPWVTGLFALPDRGHVCQSNNHQRCFMAKPGFFATDDSWICLICPRIHQTLTCWNVCSMEDVQAYLHAQVSNVITWGHKKHMHCSKSSTSLPVLAWTVSHWKTMCSPCAHHK